MLIYGYTPRDIRKAIVKRRWPITTALSLMIVMMLLVGCGTANNKDSAMSEFFKAIGSGDISVIKEKFKSAKDKEDGSWDEVENSADKVE